LDPKPRLRIPAHYNAAMRAVLLLIAAALLSLPRSGDAQVYRCTHNGQVEYLQTKPREGQCDAIDTKPPPPAGATGTSPSLQDYSKKIDESRKDEAEQRHAADAQKDKRRQACAAARGHQSLLDRFGSRQFHINEKGEQVYMTEAQYQQERQAAEQAIRTQCD
jgi:hypothetical protein